MNKRVLVISDIHANLPALQAVIKDAGDYEETWCLGDLVGYGPYPNECIEIVRQMVKLTCLIGNHDAAALKQIEVEAFNMDARISIRWTQQTLSDASTAFLNSLPEKVTFEDVTLAHGSPRNPVWEYILDNMTASTNMDYFETPFCLVGHTHLPAIYRKEGQHGVVRTVPPNNGSIRLLEKSLVNPGSVGQPRDRDARAAYAIFIPDESKWEERRVAYDIEKVQEQITKSGLPLRHAQRLAEGW